MVNPPIALEQAKNLIKQRNRKKAWWRILAALSCIVVFCTTYALILPAITMEQKTYCGKEEGTGEEEASAVVNICGYGESTDAPGDRVLICGLEEGEITSFELVCTEPEHTHTEDCYEIETALVCTEYEHTHTPECYDENGEMLCTESEHTHTEECYAEKKVLVCTQTEHTHTGDCYGKCHVHTNACYHTHTEDCFIEEKITSEPTHTHTLQCYSNPELTESRDDWESCLNHLELSGVWSEDIVTVAKTQLGYKESTENYQVQEDGQTVKGYTRYGDWYGEKYEDWDAMFVSFCLHYAGITENSFPYALSAAAWKNHLASSQWNLFRNVEEYTPKKGDIVFLDADGDALADHVGIIAEKNDKNDSIQVIQGDWENSVSYTNYLLNDGSLCGYAQLPEAENNISIQYTTQDGVTVTVTGTLPEGAQINLTEVPEETLEEMLTQVGADAPVFAYDITIIDGEGREWQPDDLGVKVSITGLEVPSGDISVAHVPDEGEIEPIESNITEDGVVFVAPGFSTYFGYSISTEENTISAMLAGATDQTTTTGTTTVAVALSWDTAPTSGEIVVTLFKDGVTTGKTLTLNSDSSWKGEFTGLEAGTYSVEYTTIDGYSYTATTTKSETEGTASWVIVKNFDDGETYLLLHDSSMVVQNSSGTSLSPGSVTVSGTTFTGVTDAMQWIYHSTGTSLQNKETNGYLTLDSSDTPLTSTSSGSAVTYNQNYIIIGSRYLRARSSKSAYATTSQPNSATAFTLYEKSAETSATLSIALTATKQEQGGEGEEEEEETTDLLTAKAPDHYKYIDSFADEGDNTETDLDDQLRNGEITDADIEDFYRLYLDVGPESSHTALDVLFIIDSSTSMSEHADYYFDAYDIFGHGLTWRCWALDTLINGKEIGSTFYPSSTAATAAKHQTTLYTNGLIGLLQAVNGDSKVAVARFSSTSEIVKNWTPVSSITSGITYTNVSGTNYIAGLQEAYKLLLDDAVKSDGNKKIMIFVSDGEPNYYYENLTSTTLLGSQAASSSDLVANTKTVIQNEFIANENIAALIQAGMLEIHAIGVGNDFTETGNEYRVDVLKALATDDNVYTVNNFQTLMTEMDKALTQGYGHYTDLKVTDTLSDYVDFYKEDLDFLIQKVFTEDGTETAVTLYENGALTDEGKKCIKENGVSIDYTTKTVTVDLLDDYEAEGNKWIRISFNVKTTEQAYTEYKENLVNAEATNGYNGVTGDEATDYSGNSTSSTKSGFYSNKSAVLEYVQSISGFTGSLKEAAFDHPVIQVDAKKYSLTVTKTVSGIPSEDKFTFELTVKDGTGAAVDLSAETLPTGVTLKTDTTNILCFSLGNGETVNLRKLFPLSSKLTLVETNSGIYSVTTTVDDLGSFYGVSTDFTINKDLAVTVLNKAGGTVLPSTGGPGTKWFTYGGLSLLTGAGVYGCILRRKRERRFNN